MARARIVFHLPARHLSDYRQTPHLELYARIAAVLEPLGARIAVRDRQAGPCDGGPAAASAYADSDLHIIENGRVQRAGVLNATLAYLAPFWHLDPRGVRSESSIGARDYRQSSVPVPAAMATFNGLRRRLVQTRRSRYSQPDQAETFPEGALAVFLQGGQPLQRDQNHCTPVEMLRAVARGAGGRSVIVKPHPLALMQDLDVIAQVLDEGLAVTPTTANVHDILAACTVTVSFNSTVAIEGFLHRKPAILFGASDFHHFAETVRDPADFAQALASALSRPPGGYAQFLQWYFVRNCLNVRAPMFTDRVLAIFATAGFSPERLGLRLPAG